MLSILGSVLGFGTSFLPKVLGFFEEKRDQAHELQMMDKQLEQQLQIGVQKLQMVNVDADIRETEVLHKEHASITKKSSQWVINLSASVRPVITYCLFIEFAALTLSVNMDWIGMEQYTMIWNSEFQAIFAAVVSFWFGQRSFNRK
jgi:hypothetical protein|tara:strand:- start:1239 stop:1676 length:438 start_codon:yes stop_codon:yes gene_type:complete